MAEQHPTFRRAPGYVPWQKTNRGFAIDAAIATGQPQSVIDRLRQESDRPPIIENPKETNG